MFSGGACPRVCSRSANLAAAWLVAVVMLGSFTCEARAASPVPATVLADLRNAAAIARQDEARMQRMSSATSDPLLAQRMRDESRRQSATTFSYVVNAAIASNPTATEAIVGAAIGIAPELREAITQSAAAAFPGFQNQIKAARPGRYDEEAAIAQPVAVGLIPAPRQPAPQEYVHPPAAEIQGISVWDPWRPVNRPLFVIYQFLDDVLVRPIAAGYGWITPDPIKKGVRNALRNLDSPIVFANDLLQLQPGDAVITLGRFIINTTAGGLGFFDVAERGGLPGHPADFDQTLNFYHVPAGPYMVLPIIGPGTLRHNLGRVVDAVADPMNWSGEVPRGVRIGRTVTTVIAVREELIEPLDTLRKDSLDWYATFRAAYYQDRNVVLRKGATAPDGAQNDLFDEME